MISLFPFFNAIILYFLLPHNIYSYCKYRCVERGVEEIKQFQGPFPPPQWTLPCPLSPNTATPIATSTATPTATPIATPTATSWIENIETVVDGNNESSVSPSVRCAMTLLGHSARLGSTLSTSIVRALPGNGGNGSRGRNQSDGSMNVIGGTNSILPKMGDLVEAQYRGRPSRSSWGYPGVTITTVNVIQEARDSEGGCMHTYDLRYPDGDVERGKSF